MKNYEKVRKILEEKNLDAILISNKENIQYISGFTGSTSYLYISKKLKVLITDFRYTTQANKEARDFNIITIDNKGYHKAINDLLKEEGIFNLAFEGQDLIYGDFLDFKKNLKVEEFIPINNELDDLRKVKSQEEIEYIRKAQSITDKSFMELLDFIEPGKTELEVAARLEYLLKTNGGHGLSFDTIVASGINTSMPHAVPSDKKLEKGDFITMDFGCIYNGYCSDMTRTVALTSVNDKQREIYNIVLKAQLAALDHIKAGLKGKEVDKKARDIIYQAGYEGYFGHGLGHSLGLYIHENPRFSPAEEEVIRENMVITVEPGIYIEGFSGVRIEDIVVVKKDGHENLTTSPKELIVI